MQTLTFNISNPIAYNLLLQLSTQLEGVEIAHSNVSEETRAYQKKNTRQNPLLSMQGKWYSNGIAQTELELKSMRDEWENDF